jgi:hypothetical protein
MPNPLDMPNPYERIVNTIRDALAAYDAHEVKQDTGLTRSAREIKQAISQMLALKTAPIATSLNVEQLQAHIDALRWVLCELDEIAGI